MNKLNINYETRKREIYHFYEHFDSLDIDTIADANDHIVDIDLKKEHFENPLEEFYNTISMCTYMINNDLYDEYFFETYKELLEEYESGKYDNYFLDIINDKMDLEKDIEIVNEYLNKDKIKSNYYDKLSEIYDKTSNN